MKILACSDLHLSEHRPVCRIDSDWYATQQEYLDELIKSCKINKFDAVILAGDIFDKTIVHPSIVNMVIAAIQNIRLVSNVYYIQGNHDTYMHNPDLVKRSSYGALSLMKESNKELGMFDFNTELKSDANYSAVAVHTFAIPDEESKLPNREQHTAQDLCRMFPNSKVIIVGDNHIPWSRKIGNQLVVNCGRFIQRTAVESKSTCGYWAIDTDTLLADYIDLSYLSVDKIDISYLEDIKEREVSKSKYEELINEIKNNNEIKYDFENTLRDFIRSKQLSNSVKVQLEKIIEHIKGE